MCPRQRSKAAHLAESLKILLEFPGTVVHRDVASRQQTLKVALAHFRQTAGLREGQPLMLEQDQGKLPLQLWLSDPGRREDLVRNGYEHSRCFYYKPLAPSEALCRSRFLERIPPQRPPG